MLAFLPAPIKGVVSGSIFAVNTVFWCLLLYPLIFLKLIVPGRSFRRKVTELMTRIGENWIDCNTWNMAVTQNIKWDIEGIEGLKPTGCSYLVIANHMAWMDIVVLQQVFNRRIPFLRFFLKQELIYVPLLGGAWWGLDFPFMKRYTREYLEKHPEKRGQDLATTRKACERFRESHISVLNFLEGTRYTPAKHTRQKSPYKHLLLPKAGGVAFMLDAMGEQFDAILDVTIFYPRGAVSLWGALCGRLHEVVIRVRKMPVPKEILGGSYLEDDEFREKTQAWVRGLWEEKDQLIMKLRARSLARGLK